MPWDGWHFERVVLLFTAIAFAMFTVQVFLLHLGGAFNRWQMWLPVLYGPVLVIVGLALTFWITPLSATAGMVFFGIGVLVGLGGVYYHFDAIGKYILGHTLRNYVAGPPIVLPIMFAAMSGLGMLAIYWAAYL